MFIFAVVSHELKYLKLLKLKIHDYVLSMEKKIDFGPGINDSLV